MKTFRVVFFAALCMILFAQLSWAGPVTLKMSTLALEGSTQDEAFKDAVKEAEEKTAGAVKFKVYYGGAMGTGDTLFRKIKFKQLNGGSFTAGEGSQYCPDLRAPSVAFVFDSYEEVDCLFPRIIGDYEKTLEANGFVLLAVIETGFSYMMSVKPVRNVSDLKSMSVWIPSDDWVGQLEFKQFGVTPKPMSLTQATSGLMTGMIDTIEGPFIGAIGLQWITKVKYVFDVPLLYTYSVLLVSKQSFDKISPEHQAIVKEAFAKYFQKDLRDKTRKDNAEAREAMITKGIEFIQPSAEDMKTFTDKMEVANQEIEATGKFTKGMVKKLEDIVAECRGSK